MGTEKYIGWYGEGWKKEKLYPEIGYWRNLNITQGKKKKKGKTGIL